MIAVFETYTDLGYAIREIEIKDGRLKLIKVYQTSINGVKIDISKYPFFKKLYRDDLEFLKKWKINHYLGISYNQENLF